MKKAVAVQAIFLIGVIIITLTFTLAVFAGWVKLHGAIANPLTCKIKFLDYCIKWKKTEFTGKPPYDWKEEAPGCTENGIPEPTDASCKDLLKQD